MDLFDQLWASISESTPKVLLAVLILLVGWLAARVLSKAIFVLLARTSIDDWAAKRLGIETGGRYGHRIERIIARAVFYILLIVVLALVLNALEFEQINRPLLNLLDEVVLALPDVLLAVIIVFIAFVVGKLLSFGLTRLLRAAKVDERVSRFGGIETTEGQLSGTLGAVAFWFVMVVGIIQALEALRMQSLVVPLQNALDELARMLPNLVGAALLLVLGALAIRWAARIATRLLTELRFDGLVERVGLVRASTSEGPAPSEPAEAPAPSEPADAPAPSEPAEAPAPSEPAEVAADESTADAAAGEAEAPSEGGSDAADTVVAGTPSESDAVVETVSTPTPAEMAESLIEKAKHRTPSEVAGMVLAVILGLFLVAQVLTIIQLGRLASLVDTLIAYLPDIGVAFVIVSAGIWAGNWVKARADELYADSEQGLQRFLGAAGRIAILTFAAAVALQQLGVAPELITTAFGILFGAVCLALALSFGLGGREVAGDIVRTEYDKYGAPPPKKASRRRPRAKKTE